MAQPAPAPPPAAEKAARPGEAQTPRWPWSPRTRVRDRRASMGKLLALGREEWGRIALGTLLLVISSAMALAYPQGMRMIIDGALAGGRRDLVDRAAIAMVGIAVLQAGTAAGRYWLFTVAGENIVTRLRERLYRAVIAQEIGFFDERRTGELTSRLASDTGLLQSAVSGNVSMALRNAVQALGGVALLLYTSPLLTALMLSVVPPLVFGAVLYGVRIRRISKAVQDALAEAGEVAEESIAGIRTVRSFAAEEKEAQRYAEAVERSFQLSKTRATANMLFMSTVSGAAFAVAALVFWYGGRLVMRGQMTIGGLTSFLVYTLFVAFALGTLTDLYADFMRALGAAERVFDILEREPAMPTRGGETIADPEGRIEFRHVSFTYPSRADVPVLQDVSFTIEPGEVVAVVGPSGAGKSTVASLLARFYDPASGAILLDGVDLRRLDPDWLRRRVGTVAQEPILFGTSIADNIRYGRPDASDAEVEAAARAANAHDFICRFPQGYETLVGERGIQLSGGQKQRVAIARAVLKDPLVLILDEATSALDAESEHLVKEALERLMIDRTTLIIAHRLSTVVGADRVLVLDGGCVVQSGSHQALLGQEGLYRRLVERQFVVA